MLIATFPSLRRRGNLAINHYCGWPVFTVGPFTCHMMLSPIRVPVLVMGQAPGSHVPAEAVIAEADSNRGKKTFHIGLLTHELGSSTAPRTEGKGE